MYSIKTDLGVTGGVTTDKDLLVKGNAVFKQNLTVEGLVTFADAKFTKIESDEAILTDITSTGTASLGTVSVSGSSTLGTTSADKVTVFAETTLNAPLNTAGIAQTSGTASLKSTTAESLTVSGATALKGNLVMDTGTTANFDSTVTTDLTVNGEAVFKGAITSEDTATFNDVVINGTLSGDYTMDNGNYNNLTVLQQATLNNVSISGSTILDGNISGTNSTATFKGAVLAGQTASLTFSYTDSTKPQDIKTSAQPYKVTSQEFVGNVGDIKRLSTGDVTYADFGFIGKGKSQMDYLDLKGNTTTGDSLPRLNVNGLTKLENLEITGTVSGLNFDDTTFNTITVSGQSNLNGPVILGSNLSSGSTGTATFNRYIVSGIAGNTGSITFSYTDSSRPTDIRSSITPYGVVTNDSEANVGVVNKSLTVGSETNGAANSFVLKGRSELDYVKIKGNSTESSTKPTLEVTGKSVLENLEITGTVSGITFDLTGQDINLNSLTATAAVDAGSVSSSSTLHSDGALTVGGDATVTGAITAGNGLTVTGGTTFNSDVSVVGQTLQVKDLVVTGTTTGVTAAANVDGLDILPNSVVATAGVSGATLTSTSDLSVGGDATVTGSFVGGVRTDSVTATGAASANSLTVAETATVGNVVSTGTETSTFAGDVTVTGDTTTVKNLVVTGIASGIQVEANVDGLDIAPNSVVSTTSVESQTLKVNTDATVTGSVTAGSVIATSVEATNAKADTIAAKTASGKVTMGSTLTANNGLEASSATITALTANNATVTGTLTTDSISVDAINPKTALQAIELNGDVTVSGTLTPGSIDLSTADVIAKSLNVSTTSVFDGDVTFNGAVDIGSATVTAQAFASSNASLVNTFGQLESDVATIDEAKISTISTAVNVTGSLGHTGGTLALSTDTAVTGDLSVSGTITTGGIDLSTADVTTKTLTSTGNVSVGGDLTVSGVFDLSNTNLSALSLASAGDVTVGDELILTAGKITGNANISGSATVGTTLAVTGATTLSSATTTGNVTVGGDLTVNGTFDLSTQDIAAQSFTSTDDVTVGGELKLTTGTITGNANISGSASVAGAATFATTVGVTGATTLSTLSTSGLATLNSLQVTGASTLQAVTAASLSTAGNITQTGTAGAASLYKLNVNPTGKFVVGSGDADSDVIAQVKGDMRVSGKLYATEINGTVNLDGQTIKPFAVEVQTDLSAVDVTATGSVTGVIGVFGDSGSPSNNALQVTGNVNCSGDFIVGGVIVGTLDQSTSDVTVKSLTATENVGSATISTTGLATLASLSVGGNAAVTGNLTVTGTSGFTGVATMATASIATANITALTTSGAASFTGATVSTSSTTATTLGGTLAVTGTSDFTGKVTVQDLEIQGTLTTSATNLFTDSINTKWYDVTMSSKSVTGNVTPNLTESVEYWEMTGEISIQAMAVVPGKAFSKFVYIKNTTAGANVSIDTTAYKVEGTIGIAANVLSIVQIVYCGVGTIVDTFVTQRAA